MIAVHVIKPSLVASVIVLGLVGWYVGSRGQQSQAELVARGETAQAQLKPFYFGVSACVGCHSEGEKQKPLLCRCDEVDRWKGADKHQDAWKVLQKERAKQMGRILWDKEDVTHEKACITCHGIPVTDPNQVDGNDIDKVLADGVSCVVCHGAHAGWVDQHGSPLEINRKKWRAMDRSEKESKHGMTDLWDPAKRTKLCVSCHIGNASESKVVTHAMYAAGHPPLPGVEIATFSKQMPQHWENLKQKTTEVLNLLKVKPEQAAFEKTKLVLVSGIVSYRESLNLLADLSSGAAEGKSSGAWPELAQFDCYACHHDLRRESWRQKRGYVGKPGRPQMRPWPTELVRVALRHVGEGDQELEAGRKSLHDAFDARPFGTPKVIRQAAGDAAGWCDKLLKRISTTEIDGKAALNLLRVLCAVAKERIPDYDSARQITWALEIINEELSDPKPPNDERIRVQLAKNDAQIRARLAELDKQLKLGLPSGTKRSIETELQDGLKRISDYDPFAFMTTIGKLAELLPPSP